jgi:hypothetical protein
MVLKFWGKSKSKRGNAGNAENRKEKSHAKTQRRKGSEEDGRTSLRCAGSVLGETRGRPIGSSIAAARLGLKVVHDSVDTIFQEALTEIDQQA